MTKSSKRYQRKLPIILVTGTPGVGKSEFSAKLAQKLQYQHLNISNVIQTTTGSWGGKFSKKWSSFLLTDKLLQKGMKTILDLKNGGIIVDHHSPSVLKPAWVDFIVVLRASTEMIFDRLTEREYSQHKIEENIDAEIMQNNTFAEQTTNLKIVLSELTRVFKICIPHRMRKTVSELGIRMGTSPLPTHITDLIRNSKHLMPPKAIYKIGEEPVEEKNDDGEKEKKTLYRHI